MLTAEQIELRRNTLGSSEVAAAIGMNRWLSPHTLWCLKRGLLESEETTATRVGHKIEPLIAELYVEETGAELAHFGTVRHPDHHWITATPDRAVRGTRRLVEIKCVGYRSAFDWGSGPEDVPDYYRCQIAWQMAVCGAEECDVAALIGGTEFRIYRIRHDQALWMAIFTAAHAFWHNHVLPGVPPPVDGSEGARTMLAKLFPRNVPGVVRPATADAEDVAARLLAAREQRAQIEAEEAALENKLRASIGEAEAIQGRTFRASWKADRAGRRTLRVTKKGEAA